MRTPFAFCLLFCVSGFSVAEQPARSVRIATYNVNWGNRRGDQALEAIARSKADILFLQENTLQSEQFLQLHLKSSYPFFHTAGHDGRLAAERFAFASKIPLREIAFSPPDKGFFGFLSASCDIGGTHVTLVNIHLSPLVVQPNSGVTGVIAAWHDAEAKHSEEIGAICRKLDARRATIVAGDFNSLSTFAAPFRLRKTGLIDSFASVHDDADSHPTWFWPTRPVPISGRIDYVFHTRHFRTTCSDVIKETGSDHFIVVSELSLVETTGAPAPAAKPIQKDKASSPRDKRQ